MYRQKSEFCRTKLLSVPHKPGYDINLSTLGYFIYPLVKACVPFPPPFSRMRNHTSSTYFHPSWYNVTYFPSQFTLPREKIAPVKTNNRGDITPQQRLKNLHGQKSELKPRRHRKLATKRVRRKRIRSHRRPSSVPSVPNLNSMTQPPTDSNIKHSWFPATSCREKLLTVRIHISTPSRTLADIRDDIFPELDQYGSMFGRLVRNRDSQTLEVGTSDRRVPGVLENITLEDFDQYGSMFGRISRARESAALELATSEATGDFNNLNLQEAGEYGTMFGRLLPRSSSDLLEPCTPGRGEVCNLTLKLIDRAFSEDGIEGSVKSLEPEQHSIEAKFREKIEEDFEECSGK